MILESFSIMLMHLMNKHRIGYDLLIVQMRIINKILFQFNVMFHFHMRDREIFDICLDDGNIYYQALRDIKFGEELLVYYGDNYATFLGINTSQLFEYPQTVIKTI